MLTITAYVRADKHIIWCIPYSFAFVFLALERVKIKHATLFKHQVSRKQIRVFFKMSNHFFKITSKTDQ